MKHNNWLLRFYCGLLLFVFGLIVLHAPLTVYLGNQFPGIDLLVKSWKEILLIVALPIGVMLAIKGGLAKKMQKDPLFWAIVGFAALHLILLAIFVPTFEQLLAGLAIDLRYVLFFTLVYIAVSLAPAYRKYFLGVGLLGAAIVASFSLLQILILPVDFLSYLGYGKDTIEPYLTIDKNTDFIRINGTLRGPNPLGASMVVVITALAAWVVAKKHTVKEKNKIILLSCLAGAALITLWASYSRSALVAALISLGVIAVIVFGKRIRPSWWVGLGVILVVLGGVLYAQKDSHFIQQVVLHNNPSGGSMRDSNEEHAASLETGTERLLNQPLGAGVGSTGSASLFSS